MASSYGMAADNVLEFEVITMDQQHTTASPTQNSDLYWALSGGGAGNYAIVLSVNPTKYLTRTLGQGFFHSSSGHPGSHRYGFYVLQLMV